MEQSRLDYLVFFVVVGLIYAWAQWTPSFADPDSFYHAKIAELMLERGWIIRDFFWLPLTTLGQAFADHHFLYHVALLPFVSHWGGLLGTKIASVLLAALAMTTFYGLLKSYRVRLPIAFALLAATCGVFMFRLNLAKATPLALVWFFLAIAAFRHGRTFWLFVLSFLFVWSHGGWAVLMPLALAFVVARLAALVPWREALRHDWRRGIREVVRPLRNLPQWPETRGALAVVAGLVAGLVINPYFPGNLRFYWEQLVQIAMVNYQGTIGVGGEWYPYTLKALINNSGAAFVLIGTLVILILTVLFWGKFERRVTDDERVARFAALFLALGFFALALRNRRHAEYFVPMAIFAEAAWLAYLWPSLVALWHEARSRRGLMLIRATLGLIVVAVYFPLLAARDAWSIEITNAKKGIEWTHYRAAGRWLMENVAPGEMVMTSDWDDFPALFYWDDAHRYVIGLDPTFLYRADAAKHQAFVEITTGRQKTEVAATIRREFGASHALVERDHWPMIETLTADPNATVVYEDNEVVVFGIDEGL